MTAPAHSTIRLTEDERDLAVQIAKDEARKARAKTGARVTETMSDGIRIALLSEARRRNLVPRTAGKKGAVEG